MLNHFQNGHHNTTKIQHCSISKVAFDLFTDILSAVGLPSTGNRKHIKTICCSSVVYSIKQQIVFMCFLLPVDGKPTADKMSVNKSKATFEIEQC
jgi:hypothetical protein